jgi:hypothetical protein
MIFWLNFGPAGSLIVRQRFGSGTPLRGWFHSLTVTGVGTILYVKRCQVVWYLVIVKELGRIRDVISTYLP